MKKISNYFLTIFIIIFGLGLFFYSPSNIIAVRNSLDLFISSVFPSLFPFLIVTELLSHTVVISVISSKLEKCMKTVFYCPSISAYPFIMGLISGYPVGAKIVANLRSENKISKSVGEKLLIFTNNAGPLFIIGSVGIGIFQNQSIGYLLYLVHFLSCIITGFFFGHFYKKEYREISIANSEELDLSTLGEIISQSIRKAFYTLSTVCGFVIIFSLLISMLQSSGILSLMFGYNSFTEYLILGTLEITSGIKSLSTVYGMSLLSRLMAISFLLGFGGVSVLLQVWSIISKTDLQIKPYLLGKLFNGGVSVICMFFLANFFL